MSNALDNETTALRIPLNPKFGFVHRALTEKDFFPESGRDPRGYLYRLDPLTRKLKDFLRSEGGCLLLCGPIGVGKTSFVNSVLAELKRERDLKIIDIHINVARHIDPVKLKYKIIRRLYTELTGKREEVLERLEKAYLKTYFAIKQTSTQSDTKSTEAEFGLKWQETVISRLMRKQEQSIADAVELILDEYDDIEVEDDLESIIGEIPDWYSYPPLHKRIWGNAVNKVRNIWNSITIFIHGHPEQLKVVIVLDELDKLDRLNKMEVENLIGSLKNILSATGIKFLLISGCKTVENIQKEIRGEIEGIVGESISGLEYLPCLWKELRHFCSWIVDTSTVPADSRDWFQTDFQDYITYVSRGNLRQFFRKITDHSRGPFLELSDIDKKRITMIAEIQRQLESKMFINIEPKDPLRRDQRRLETYRILDYVLNLDPGTTINIQKNSFSHSGAWLQDKTSSQEARFDVDLNTISSILEELGYIRISD